MHLVEILLPIAANDGKPFPPEKLEAVGRELAETFGGLTAFTRVPARGVVKYGGDKVHDDIVVLEVMADELDRSWWSSFRGKLEREFEQDEILIRASAVVRL